MNDHYQFFLPTAWNSPDTLALPRERSRRQAAGYSCVNKSGLAILKDNKTRAVTKSCPILRGLTSLR
jgi:hypothetical protein